MQCVHIFLFACLLLVPAVKNAQTIPDLDVVVEGKQAFVPTYLKDLEELGYCVISQVLSTFEAEVLYQRVWLEYIEKAWPNCRMNDRSNWKEAFPIHNKYTVFTGSAGQTQVMWDLRQDPRIVDIFAQIWNTNELVVSMDGLSFMCPPEIRDGYYEPWPHVDQATLRRQDGFGHNNCPPIDFVSESLLKTNPFTIQGQFLFEESLDGDGGFYCIPRSHLRFAEFAPQTETLYRKAKIKFLLDFFNDSVDESGNPYRVKHIAAPRGSLILWDSRTIHWNQYPSKDRPYSANAKVRMVGYLCYVPKARLTNEARALRKEVFESGASTGHNPACPEPKFTKDHMQQEFRKYLEDSSYTQPKIHLTPLGESLLSLRDYP